LNHDTITLIENCQLSANSIRKEGSGLKRRRYDCITKPTSLNQSPVTSCSTDGGIAASKSKSIYRASSFTFTINLSRNSFSKTNSIHP
ncbi:MAG: hypothetical protein P8M80_14565, partial [Pirellulaceae bacterium]|nr:hypothetical protein [Pirellulaceae bacterium]